MNGTVSFQPVFDSTLYRQFRPIRSLLVLMVVMMPAVGWGEEEKSFTLKPAAVESEGAVVGQTKLLALDQTNWQTPQSAFKWIAMARDITTPWDSFGRQGWMTDDAYVQPVDPGVSQFSADTEIFYLVFEVSALDAPSQYRAAWYHVPDGETPAAQLTGTDALFMEMNEKSGYLEIFKPEGGWKTGKYLLKLYFESPGQELYEPNAIGTMTFTITE